MAISAGNSGSRRAVRENGEALAQDHAVDRILRPKMKRKIYETELRKLQVELCHLQDWVKSRGLRIIVVSSPAQCHADVARHAARPVDDLDPQLVSARTEMLVPELINLLRHAC